MCLCVREFNSLTRGGGSISILELWILKHIALYNVNTNILFYSILINFYFKTKQRIYHTFLHYSCPYKLHKQHYEWEWNPLLFLHTAYLLAWKCTVFHSQQFIFSFNNNKYTKICESEASARKISEVCFFYVTLVVFLVDNCTFLMWILFMPFVLKRQLWTKKICLRTQYE